MLVNAGRPGPARETTSPEKQPRRGYLAIGRALEAEWQALSARYLPILPHDSVWRISRGPAGDDAEQGWKLHLSATVLTAGRILKRVAPLLHAEGVLFKAPRSLEELRKLNCGLYYGFSQVGKFITVYPKTAQQAAALAGRLDRLTRRQAGPVVPYDQPYRRDSRVSYRYGSFSRMEIENPDGTRTPALRDPAGELIPDRREPGAAVPPWLDDPFPRAPRRRNAARRDSLWRFFKVFEAMSQRGKGGVYRALDLSAEPARLCVVKEGRRNGETDWDGRDGYWRVRYEAGVLARLAAVGIRVPRVYAAFRAGRHYYLVTEFIEGESLQQLLFGRRGQLPLRLALDYAIKLADVVERIHAAGWVWRDCKPLNVMVCPDGRLRPLDFEGACRDDAPDEVPWGTTGYIPPELLEDRFPDERRPEDLYALGVTLHQLITGRTPDAGPPPPVGRLRRRVPREIKAIIAALLDDTPESRPAARQAAEDLRAIRASFGDQKSDDRP